MKKLLFTLISVVTLANATIASHGPADAASDAAETSPQHLQDTIKLLLNLQHHLTQELFEDVKASKSNDEILGVAKNLTTLREAVTLLQALQHVHKEIK